jgi:hypothetical protein
MTLRYAGTQAVVLRRWKPPSPHNTTTPRARRGLTAAGDRYAAHGGGSSRVCRQSTDHALRSAPGSGAEASASASAHELHLAVNAACGLALHMIWLRITRSAT